MPGLNGIEVACRIRAAEGLSGGRPTPIVAITADAFPENREACLAAGIDAFLTKPLDRERLIAALGEVCHDLSDTAAQPNHASGLRACHKSVSA